jgi:hypothetical protein
MSYKYLGFEYLPDILEDEDTRRYIHYVYLKETLVGSINKSSWYSASYTEFKLFVLEYIAKNNIDIEIAYEKSK